MGFPYYVQSVKTKYSPVTDGAEDGAVLQTKNGESGIPAGAILTFNAAVHNGRSPVIVSIAGPDGLYITLPDNAVEGTKLIWTKTQYLWVVNPNSDHLTYTFTPADGQDFYMFDEFGIGPVIEVKSGGHITPPQSFFTLTPLLD